LGCEAGLLPTIPLLPLSALLLGPAGPCWGAEPPNGMVRKKWGLSCGWATFLLLKEGESHGFGCTVQKEMPHVGVHDKMGRSSNQNGFPLAKYMDCFLWGFGSQIFGCSFKAAMCAYHCDSSPDAHGVHPKGPRRPVEVWRGALSAASVGMAIRKRKRTEATFGNEGLGWHPSCWSCQEEGNLWKNMVKGGCWDIPAFIVGCYGF